MKLPRIAWNAGRNAKKCVKVSRYTNEDYEEHPENLIGRYSLISARARNYTFRNESVD